MQVEFNPVIELAHLPEDISQTTDEMFLAHNVILITVRNNLRSLIELQFNVNIISN